MSDTYHGIAKPMPDMGEAWKGDTLRLEAAAEVARRSSLGDVAPLLAEGHAQITELEQQLAAIRSAFGLPPFGGPNAVGSKGDDPEPGNIVDLLLLSSRNLSARVHMANASLNQIRERIG